MLAKHPMPAVTMSSTCLKVTSISGRKCAKTHKGVLPPANQVETFGWTKLVQLRILFVCWTGSKQSVDGSAIEGTGPAPDGDEDAIMGIILAVKVV
jgi:hypothetical protein